MASPETLDFQRLLAPISDDDPAGPALRGNPSLSAAFYQIRDTSKAARDAERRAFAYSLLSETEKEEEPRPDTPDWQVVLEGSTDIIAEKSKDLWVAAWMIEALVRQHDFAGLRDGFRLVRELCETYWGDLHPRPDIEEGEDISETLSQMSSLNGILIAPIEQISITPETSSFGALTSADYKDASDPKVETPFTLEMFDSAVREANPEFFQTLAQDIEEAGAQFALLDQLWDEKCGQDADGMSLAPATSDIKKTIAECRDRVHSLAKHILGSDAEENDPSSDDGSESVTGNGPDSGRGSIGDAAVRNREEAFRALVKVADFFKRTEPHSPISYKLEEAVRWGRLTLPELMEELMQDLVSDDTTRQELFRRAGIAVSPPREPE